MNDPLPHCARCDLKGCDGIPTRHAEAEFIREAGEKPKEGIMRSAWEHSLMVFCRAWKEAQK